MTITKTKSNTYRLRLYYPKDIQDTLGVSKLYSKTFKTQKEAKADDLDFHLKIKEIRDKKEMNSLELKGDSTIKDFYEETWLNDYKSGLTSFYPTPPTRATIDNTTKMFRLHILPMFSNYTLNYLNNNKNIVLRLMAKKASEYANFKTLRSYVNSIFDWAEELEYIDHNKLNKSLKRIKPVKKIQLQSSKNEEDLFLSFEQLKDWINAVNSDLSNNLLSFQDYLLFQLTLFLSDRKSETYALKWKNIDFDNKQVTIEKALNRYGDEKSTKANKITIFRLSEDLLSSLREYKKLQQVELSTFNINQTNEQLLFSYCDRKGNINQPLHTDYLNYRMKSIERRHPELAHATPHKLRHTGATLAKQSGASLEAISNALTHSDTETTKTYVNTPDVIQMTAGQLTLNELSKNNGVKVVSTMVSNPQKNTSQG
ncbi:tyrosine-type recombinase/integrase [Lactobacillus terrae]|uniref:tyrosine-type recombinase/integrase n=1 Tax=Lactobacillus terrae TaxID=2269374 RepID=UPI000C1B7ADA|nr:site-specific integrase [Lactobacillus terrae]